MSNFEALRQQKQDLLAEKRPPRAREAAKKLGISEAEYVALSCGETCSPLASDRFSDLLLKLGSVGEMMALTRNDAMVLEHHGVYRDGVSRHNHVIFNTPEIDLRLRVSDWKYGFAVDENGRQSLQFFDKYGEAAHKVYVTDHSDKAAYESLLHEFGTTGGFHEMNVKTKEPAGVIEDVDVDETAIRKDWKALDNAHHVNALLKAYGVTRPQAYRHLGDDALALKADALKSMLEKAADLEIPLLIFVPNDTSTQIHNGVVKKLMEMGPWFNVLDPGFNLHANMELVTEAWMVIKHLGEHDKTCSMELFDANQKALMMVYLHPDGQVDKEMKAMWADVLMSLQEKGN